MIQTIHETRLIGRVDQTVETVGWSDSEDMRSPRQASRARRQARNKFVGCGVQEVSDVHHLASCDYHKIMMIAACNHKWKLLNDCRLKSDKQIIALFVCGLLTL